ncbi:MAG: nucleoside-diphosphate-sugar pyrophosphorylase [Pelagibacterales bacterium]|nr:nucleoside-diphosphate-sugar pyrophosphorylase [Pelagibacterales bacterium]
MKKIEYVIIQAGGRGSRLETLTNNKPKCLVPIENKPLVFHQFEKFMDKKFLIICDYKHDVLEKYLSVFAENIDYKIVRTNKKGTCSGIKEAMKNIPENEPFAIVWCDLLFSDNTFIPQEIESNMVALSKSFECRWSFIEDVFEKVPSKENGVSGLFLLSDKSQIENIAEEGEFVLWLKNNNIKFGSFDLVGAREIGTMLSYNQNENKDAKCRPFNKMIFESDCVIKLPANEYGKEIMKDEIAWYKKVKELNYEFTPKIFDFEPFKMERVNGRNVFEYKNFTFTQKKAILFKIVERLKTLHNIANPIEANYEDCFDNYIAKTFARINKVKSLIPFSDREYIAINGKKCRNIFGFEEQFSENVKKYFPKDFYLIHGDPTFSNIMIKNEKVDPVLIDPRGYFGKTKFFGDKDYDWAKLYYSIVGNYDQFNRRNFALEVTDSEIFLRVDSNYWEELETYFFELTKADPLKIRILHSLIWLSLTTYASEDYDSICTAFYKGLLCLNEINLNL